MSVPRIAIAGAGPSGLTLARLLQHSGIKCTIFELDLNRNARSQGGLIDLHADMGQRALREAGLIEEFRKHCLPEADSMKLVKADGTVVWDENEKDEEKDLNRQARDRPEIDRARLRDILLDSVDPDLIQWNSKLIRVEPSKTNPAQFDLHFAGYVAEGFDLVVGADGAWSKVRPLVSAQLPEYSGVSMIEMRALNVSERKRWLSDYVGKGSLFMFDEGRMFICQRNGYDGVRVYAGVRKPESWIQNSGIKWEDPIEARKQLAEQYFGDVHDDLKRLIFEASDSLLARPLYMLPVGFKWPSRPGVTLLGDAAHLMTPFAGVGVNVAMNDAMLLAHALSKQRDNFAMDMEGSLKQAITEYEEQMFKIAKKNMEKTYQGLVHHFKADGIEHRMAHLQERAKHIKEARANGSVV
ncbi:e04008b3-3263-421f-8def-14f1d683e26d-CDS [Sclerotinia trifoliorum]|uniref:E04008b3-3263-421f-8def-14f1d683e26d-CDS n=1 Tax=Sclerotinia trifoliorum TaxID=28548 RepID=A0A8H2ZRW5_9HELO|nr:e04008b3-3263-421f-8def-14f1d683e26d-CDS [Sclerotinia trifoliorum]